jgi:chromosome segregation ATPase
MSRPWMTRDEFEFCSTVLELKIQEKARFLSHEIEWIMETKCRTNMRQIEEAKNQIRSLHDDINRLADERNELDQLESLRSYPERIEASYEWGRKCQTIDKSYCEKIIWFKTLVGEKKAIDIRIKELEDSLKHEQETLAISIDQRTLHATLLRQLEILAPQLDTSRTFISRSVFEDMKLEEFLPTHSYDVRSKSKVGPTKFNEVARLVEEFHTTRARLVNLCTKLKESISTS